jgi:hypothetical protein
MSVPPIKEELGMIKDVNVGVRDTNRPILWFTVALLNGDFLQVLTWVEAEALIRQSQVYSIKDLNGKPCVVECCDGLFKFRRLL